MGSLKSLFFTMVLIGLLVFIVGVLLTQLVSERLNSMVEDNAVTAQATSEELRLFRTLDVSCLVLFMSLTGGLDWRDGLDPLMEHISPYIAVIYCLFISFGVLCMLNVVTGIFVESACNSSAEEKDANMVTRLQTFLFHRGHSDGVISWDDFAACL